MTFAGRDLTACIAVVSASTHVQQVYVRQAPDTVEACLLTSGVGFADGNFSLIVACPR